MKMYYYLFLNYFNVICYLLKFSTDPASALLWPHESPLTPVGKFLSQ